MEHPFFKYPKNLYHAIYHPVTVKTSDEEAIARTAEYGDTYIHQEFPKMVFGQTVNNAEEEQHFLASRIDAHGNLDGPATPEEKP
jgi:hypothetical protein